MITVEHQSIVNRWWQIEWSCDWQC